MNVQGPGIPFLPQTASPLPASRPARPAAAPAAAEPAREAAPARNAAQAQSLWEVLTEEERAFFAQQAAIGPLTYGPGSARAESAPAPTGQRIDRTG